MSHIKMFPPKKNVSAGYCRCHKSMRPCICWAGSWSSCRPGARSPSPAAPPPSPGAAPTRPSPRPGPAPGCTAETRARAAREPDTKIFCEWKQKIFDGKSHHKLATLSPKQFPLVHSDGELKVWTLVVNIQIVDNSVPLERSHPPHRVPDVVTVRVEGLLHPGEAGEGGQDVRDVDHVL